MIGDTMKCRELVISQLAGQCQFTVAQQHQITGFSGLQNTPSYSDYTRTANGSTITFSVGSSSNNAEPRRCHRRDGKKRRCSRNVVPQQKFCWEHKYRAQAHYRARKLVDGSTQQAPTGSINSNVVVPPTTFSMSTSTGDGASTM
ncbi:hypothetical protein Q3G72_012586 [Acer saccharum]|nr:hypothetical protein Q3G72_012586 [Acer saccharum]